MAIGRLASSFARHVSNHKIATGFNLANMYFAADQYQAEREEGKGVLSAGLDAIVDTVMPMTLGFQPWLVYKAITALPGAVVSGTRFADSQARAIARQNRSQAFTNASFSDTEQAFTMRQAGMAIAQRSRYNVQRAMLGQEAKYMAR